MIRRMLILATGLLMAAVFVPTVAQDAALGAGRRTQGTVPEPSIIPLSWQLDLTYRKPMRMVIDVAGEKEPVYLWYLIYTISSPTDQDIYYLPRIQMLTDKLELVDAQMAISPPLFKRIKDLNKAKFLEEPLRVTGKILSGEDNARDTVAVFPFKGDPKWFRVFFSGLSGERREVQVPPIKPGDPPGKVTMEKVRVLEFAVPGHTPVKGVPPVVLRLDKWAMRTTPPKPKMDVDLDAAADGRVGEAIRGDGRPIARPPTTQPAGNQP